MGLSCIVILNRPIGADEITIFTKPNKNTNTMRIRFRGSPGARVHYIYNNTSPYTLLFSVRLHKWTRCQFIPQDVSAINICHV